MTAIQTDAAHAFEQARRTGCQDAIDAARNRELIAGFRAHNAAACDYSNHLAARAAADPIGAARDEARRQENEIGNAHYSHS